MSIYLPRFGHFLVLFFLSLFCLFSSYFFFRLFSWPCRFLFSHHIIKNLICANAVPIGLSRVQVVPANATPKFQTKLGDTQIVRTTGQKNNNNKSLGTATITTTTSAPGGHIVKGKQKKFNILLEHNYA